MGYKLNKVPNVIKKLQTGNRSMNIRVLTGFLTGAAAILLFGWFLALTADNELKKTVPVQVVPVAETGIQKDKEHHQEEISKTEPEKQLPDDQSKPPVSVPVPSPENISRITATESSERNLTTQKQISDSGPALNAAVDFVQTSPAGDEQNHEMPNSKKFFFWSPFSLNAKAELFANYITSVSGVECGVKKTGAGRYQVYFPFEDESDRDEKSSLIKGTGLKF